MFILNSPKTKSICFICLLLVVSAGQSKAQMVVQKWSDGHLAALSLTFDDGTKSHYVDLRPILNKYNLKATFYLNTSLLSDLPIDNAHSGSWEEFKTMADEGHELGSHGVNHPDLTTLPEGDSLTENTIVYELSASKKIIEQRMGDGYHCVTHAYPFCTNNAIVREITSRYYEGARTCGSMYNASSPNYMALNSQGYSWPAVRNTFFDDFRNLNSFFKTVETNVIKKGGWGILLAHEVLPFVDLKTAGTWEPTSSEWMIEASKWLSNKMNQGQLWIAPAADVTRYAKERDAFYAENITETADTLSYHVGDSLDNAVFDFPLSVDITVPPTWKVIRVVQEKNIHHYIVTTEADSFIRAQILPFEDTVYVIKLPDKQLVMESATVQEQGNEVLIKFNIPVNFTDTTFAGITIFINQKDTAVITGISYPDSDSLQLKINLADSIYAGTLVKVNLGNETSISAKNRSKLVEDEYRSLSVSTGIIEQDDQSADIDFYVFSTSAFNLDLASGWSAVSKTTGWEYDTIQVHFDKNETTSDRSDTIFIQSEDGFEEMIVLSQPGAEPVISGEEKPGETSNRLKLFPSPASDILNLSIPEQLPLPANLSLVSINGQKLRTIAIHETQVSIDVKELEPGLYILQLKSDGSFLEERFVVQ